MTEFEILRRIGATERPPKKTTVDGSNPDEN